MSLRTEYTPHKYFAFITTIPSKWLLSRSTVTSTLPSLIGISQIRSYRVFQQHLKVNCFVFSTLFVHLVLGTSLCSLLNAVTLFLIYFVGFPKCLAPGGLLVSVPQDLFFMDCTPFFSPIIQALALGSTYTKHSYTTDWSSESSSDSCSFDSC